MTCNLISASTNISNSFLIFLSSSVSYPSPSWLVCDLTSLFWVKGKPNFLELKCIWSSQTFINIKWWSLFPHEHIWDIESVTETDSSLSKFSAVYGQEFAQDSPTSLWKLPENSIAIEKRWIDCWFFLKWNQKARHVLRIQSIRCHITSLLLSL